MAEQSLAALYPPSIAAQSASPHPGVDNAGRQKDALYRLTDQFQRAKSREDIYSAALYAILTALPCDRASILLFDDAGTMRFVAWRGLSESYRQAVEGHSPWAADERNPTPICIDDVDTAGLGVALEAVIRSEGIRAAAFIPLVASGKLLGKFMSYFDAPHAFDAAEVQFSLTIGRQLALAIEREYSQDALRGSEQRLRESVERLAEELQAAQRLQALSTELIRPDNIQALYQQIMDAAVTLMHADFASLQMYYPEPGGAGALRLLAFRGFSPAAATFWELVRADSGSTCGEALRTGRRVIAPDVEASECTAGTADLTTYRETGVRAVQTTPLLSRSGKLVGMISTHWREQHEPSKRDLSLLDILARQAADLIERSQAEAALRESEERLRQADRRKDEFLAMLAHELRNPLAPIRNVSELLARMLPAESKLQEPVAMIKRQTAQLTRLVDDLLDVSRITAGRIELKRATIEVPAIIEQALETVKPLLDEKRHIVSITSNYGQLSLDGDFARLEQCLVNVLSNAAKYTDAGGEIRIQTRSEDGWAVIEIADTGVGISAELLPRIFDLFVQSDRTLDRAQGGLGIGLSVVKRLVEMHDGRICGRSPGVGQGSTFEIRLPLLADPAQERAEFAPADPRPRRILIVDDNADAASSLALLLEIDGHHAEAVFSATAALERLESFRAEVILLDIGLPVMDGYALARRIRELSYGAAPQLVALTGYGQAADVARARAAGFDEHMVKPLQFDLLRQMLERDSP